jgi:photosystem II stability/assembly factor-like uncharacterized protein
MTWVIDLPGINMNNRSYLILYIVFWVLTIQAHAQWVWQNPKPTGNDLLSIKFINQTTGWFAGRSGTIFKTTDGGVNWTPQFTGYTGDITAIDPVDENTVWAIGYGYSTSDIDCDPSFKIFNSNDGGKHWSLKLNGATFLCDSTCGKFKYIEGLSFSDPSNGYVVGDSGLILKTTDAGENWTLIEEPRKYQLKSVQFFDALTGYVAGGSGLVSIGHYPVQNSSSHEGIILKTTDGGVSWDSTFTDTIMVYDIFFRSPEKGWAIGRADWYIDWGVMGGKEFILKTTDAGETWQRIVESDTLPSWLLNIRFIDDSSGWLAGTWGTAAKTTDGGSTWSWYYPAYYYLADIYCFDILHAIAVGSNNVICETTDGGNTWINRDTTFLGSSEVNDIFFFNRDTGLVVAGSIWQTTDKGITWEDKSLTGYISAFGVGNNDCWAVGYGGKISYSSDAGNSWITQASGTTGNLLNVQFVSDKIGWAVGGDNIIKTTDGGNNWVIQKTQSGASFLAIVTQDSSRAWVYGGYTTLKTINGGVTWDAIDSVYGIYFLNPDTGWVKINDVLYRTLDGGKNLERIGRVGTPYFGKTQFADAINGWLYYSDQVSATHDGGYNWWFGLIENSTRSIYSIYLIDSTHGWVGTRDGGLIRYGYPELMTSISGDNDNIIQPINFYLEQNYPNPFNPVTRISYSISYQTHVSLKIFNILGQDVKTVIDELQYPGEKTITFDATNLPSGVYFYRLTTERHTEVKKMVLMK